jgi:ATP-dependent RNA helicase DeaD
MVTSLEDLKLRPELLAACRKQGFKDATPIQAMVIPVVMQGKDVMVEAKTGSGKTLAYGLPLLMMEPTQTQFPEVLVLSPTRELATQVATVLARTAAKLDRTVVALAGGSGMDKQAAQLKVGATIVVGTMGRVEEMLVRGLLKLDHLRVLVLDEVDELLHGGFSKNLSVMLKQLHGARQTLLFSATISKDVEKVAHQFMNKPLRLQISAKRELPTELSHRVFRTTVKRRLTDMAAFIRAERPYQSLVFCGTRHEAEEVREGLSELGLEAEFLHGELSPTKRRQIMETFREGGLPILVATDLVARGLDLPGVDVVINHAFPDGPAEYVHRAGRTGRAGKPGVVISMLIEQQQGRFDILKQTFPFEKVELHGGEVLVRPLKTREERDLEFRRLPRNPGPKDEASAPAKPQPSRSHRSAPRGKKRQR